MDTAPLWAENQESFSAVETLRREREQRRRNLQRDREEPKSKRFAQTVNNGNKPVASSYTTNRLPDGWLDCPAFGSCIGNIIPSKVPLDETFHDIVPPGKRYSFKQLIDKQRISGREIGLVIDLTNSKRYYKEHYLRNLHIKYEKIACKGRDEVPDNESVNIFVHTVTEFLSRQSNSKKPRYILVHCTHGHNRTGFMIVHYLMRTQLTSVTKALDIFCQSRTPGIYKPDYIKALYDSYHEFVEDLVCPPTPEWKSLSDLIDDALKDEDDESQDSTTPLLMNEEKKDITNDDILGDAIPDYQQTTLRDLCYRLLSYYEKRGNTRFPGSHPVSLNREKLQLLRHRYYHTAWKADGTRYMMLMMRDGCYLIDRTFTFRRVQMRFPKRKSMGVHEMTLIDGEMVIDVVPNGGGSERRFLAYDLMALNGESKVKLPFSERWQLLEEEIIIPRNIERGTPTTYRYEMELFRVRRKPFWPLSCTEKLLSMSKDLSHGTDGLILQGWDEPYVCLTDENLLKWKHAHMNTVDFLFEIGSENRYLLFVHERGKKKLMDRECIKFDSDEDVSAKSGEILECSWDPQDHCWVYMRTRKDKDTPNDIKTYNKVLRSIHDNITTEVLLDNIYETLNLPMYQERIARIEKGNKRKR